MNAYVLLANDTTATVMHNTDFNCFSQYVFTRVAMEFIQSKIFTGGKDFLPLRYPKGGIYGIESHIQSAWCIAQRYRVGELYWLCSFH